MASLLPRCDKCDKEFEKLLQCGRCKNAFYCRSSKCLSRPFLKHLRLQGVPEPGLEDAQEHLPQARGGALGGSDPARTPGREAEAKELRGARPAGDCSGSRRAFFGAELSTRAAQGAEFVWNSNFFRGEETKETNGKMMTAMRDGPLGRRERIDLTSCGRGGEPLSYLPKVKALKVQVDQGWLVSLIG